MRYGGSSLGKLELCNTFDKLSAATTAICISNLYCQQEFSEAVKHLFGTILSLIFLTHFTCTQSFPLELSLLSGVKLTMHLTNWLAPFLLRLLPVPFPVPPFCLCMIVFAAGKFLSRWHRWYFSCGAWIGWNIKCHSDSKIKVHGQNLLWKALN